MKRTVPLRPLLVSALIVAGGLPAAGAAPAENAGGSPDVSERIFNFPYLSRDLPNGLRVIIVPTDYPDVVTLQIPMQTGSRNEVEEGKSGFAHFFEHMMFRGTEKYPPDLYGSIMKNAGADQNAYTSDDYTNYHVTFTRPDLEKVIEVEADRFRNLKYSEEQFRTEAQAVKGEYLKNYSNPLQKLFETLQERAFTVHPYRHTTMGFFADIEDMPNQIEYSKLFFDRWYRPGKAALIVVGDIDPEATFRLVKKHWGRWKPGDFSAEIPQEPPPEAPVYAHVEWDAPTQPWYVMAFRGPAFNANEMAMPVMDIISQIFFSESSDLYQKLVIEEQFVDQLFPYFPNQIDPGLLVVGARLTDPEHAAAVRDAILDTFVQIRSERVDEGELERTKARLRYGFAAQMDSSEAIGAILASYAHFERTPVETINALYRSYDAVTSDDVLEYANRYFVDKARTVVTLSQESSMQAVAETPSIDARVAQLAEREPVTLDVVEMPSETAPLVDFSLVFHTGAAADPPGKRGLAVLTAAMVTDGGSMLRTTQEINDAMYPMAASFDAQVDKEMTKLSGSVHKDNLETWYRLAREQLLSPGWREEDFERLKTQQINAVRTDLVGNNDEELGKEVLYRFIYGDGHPYGSLNLGATDDIERLTLDDVKAFYAKHYTRNNLTVGIAGGYGAGFAARLEEDFGKMSAGRREAVELQPVPGARGHAARIVEKETPAVAVSFGFPIDVRRGDDDWVALWLVRSWLGEHRNSNARLYQRIRETRGMNYGDYAYIEYFPRGMFQFYPDPNLGRRQQIFQVWLRPLRDNNDAHFATRAALYEMQKLLENGLTEEEFEASRNFLNKFVSLLTKTQSRQLGYGIDSAYYDVPAFAEYVRAGLADLTVEEVNRAIRRHLHTDNVKFVFVTTDAEDLRRRLMANEPSPLEYNAPKPEDLLEEDRIIQVLPLAFTEQSVEVVPAGTLFR